MTALLEELRIWLEAEQAQPNEMCENDQPLLDRVTVELNDMRLHLSGNLYDENAWKPYKELNNALTELLMYRINKYARIKEGLRV
jgi:hypothetical protein